MKLLALELTTEACSIAVENDGIIVARHEVAPRQHAELSLAWSDELLAQAGLRKSELDAVAVSIGPGAFTGVRLAIAMGQGIALGLGKPLLGVSTLAVLAMEAVTPDFRGSILALIDARMGEVYAGRFEWDGSVLRSVSTEVVIDPALLDIEGVDASWVAVGTGIDAAEGVLRSRLPCALLPNALPKAVNLLKLARYAEPRSPESVEPAYLRNNVALTIVEQQALRDLKAKK